MKALVANLFHVLRKCVSASTAGIKLRYKWAHETLVGLYQTQEVRTALQFRTQSSCPVLNLRL